MPSLQSKYYYFHFIDEEVETYRGHTVCSRYTLAITVNLNDGHLAPAFMLFHCTFRLKLKSVCNSQINRFSRHVVMQLKSRGWVRPGDIIWGLSQRGISKS